VWPILEKLRKVEAVSGNPAATDGEKAAAEAAADRLRARVKQDAERKLAANPGLMYVLGRAWGRAQRPGAPSTAGPAARPASRGLMYLLGRAVRRTVSKW
jgi:hypothetical protein